MTADSDSLSALTVLFLHGSTRYRALPPPARGPADAALMSATVELIQVAPVVGSWLKVRLVDDYKATVRELQLDGWLTPTHAAVLASFADVL